MVGNLVTSKWDSADLIQNTQDPERLIEVFRGGNKELCEASCEKIAHMPETKYSHLDKALKDSDERVRKWAAVAIGLSAERNGEEFLITNLAPLLEDKCVEVREAAHGAIKRILNAILNIRNMAENGFDNSGGLKKTLLNMLGCEFEAARETAYAFMKDILSEEVLLKTIADHLPKVKGDAAARTKVYHERAIKEFQLSERGLMKDKEGLSWKRPIEVIEHPARVPKNRKAVAN